MIHNISTVVKIAFNQKELSRAPRLVFTRTCASYLNLDDNYNVIHPEHYDA